MKSKIPFILLLAILLLGFVWYMILSSWFASDSVPVDEPFTDLAIDNQNINEEQSKISIEGVNGEQLHINKDFLNEAVESQYNVGLYELRYTSEDSDAPFVVQYVSETDFFNIILQKEPLAETRLEAERYLGETLGLSEDELCNLKYTVSVPWTVSEYVSGYSLGFSFCSGSAQL